MTHSFNSQNLRRNDTTDLEEVRKRPTRFTWGKVIGIHTIGRYTFVEYFGRAYENGHPTGEDETKPSFHIYVDGKSTSQSASTIESALVHAIALGKIEVNAARWMTIAALKLLDLES